MSSPTQGNDADKKSLHAYSRHLVKHASARHVITSFGGSEMRELLSWKVLAFDVFMCLLYIIVASSLYGTTKGEQCSSPFLHKWLFVFMMVPVYQLVFIVLIHGLIRFLRPNAAGDIPPSVLVISGIAVLLSVFSIIWDIVGLVEVAETPSKTCDTTLWNSALILPILDIALSFFVVDYVHKYIAYGDVPVCLETCLGRNAAHPSLVDTDEDRGRSSSEQQWEDIEERRRAGSYEHHI